MRLGDFAVRMNGLLFSRSWRGAYLPLAGWEVSMRLGDFAAWMNGLLFFSPQWTVGRLTPCGLGCFGVAGRFCGVDE